MMDIFIRKSLMSTRSIITHTKAIRMLSLQVSTSYDIYNQIIRIAVCQSNHFHLYSIRCTNTQFLLRVGISFNHKSLSLIEEIQTRFFHLESSVYLSSVPNIWCTHNSYIHWWIYTNSYWFLLIQGKWSACISINL